MQNKLSLSHRNEEPESSTFYLVGTPIGNLNDLSPRAINILKKVNLICCEDTRQTMKIMSKYKFTNNLISCNKHNSKSKIPKIINKLHEGESIALVSDAGMPIICDPGEDIVKAVRSEGLDIICIPGPCAAITALVASGMPSSSFVFEGFLPKKTNEREKCLMEISQNKKTTIIFESPHRIIQLLNELKKFCGGNREIQVSRELTKKFEEHIGDNIDDVLNFFENKEIIGEFTIVMKGICQSDIDSKINTILIKKELKDLINAGLSLSSASKYLAKKNNLTKSFIYKMY